MADRSDPSGDEQLESTSSSVSTPVRTNRRPGVIGNNEDGENNSNLTAPVSISIGSSDLVATGGDATAHLADTTTTPSSSIATGHNSNHSAGLPGSLITGLTVVVNNDKNGNPPRNEGEEEDASSTTGVAPSTTSAASSIMTETAAPLLAKFSSWGKQANANAKDFWKRQQQQAPATQQQPSQHNAANGSSSASMMALAAETVKKSLPLTSATLDPGSPMPVMNTSKPVSETASLSTTTTEQKATAEAKEEDAVTTGRPVFQEKEASVFRFPGTSNNAVATASSTASGPARMVNFSPSVFPPSSFSVAGSSTSANTGPAMAATLRAASSLLSPSTQNTEGDADSSFYSYGDDDTASSYWSSTYTSDNEAFAAAAAAAAKNGGNKGPASSTSVRGTLKWAAASVVDSVQTYRGRYNSNSTSVQHQPVHFVRTSSDVSSLASATHRSSLVTTPAVSASPHVAAAVAAAVPPSPSATAASSASPHQLQPSQTHRILQSRAKQHIQDLMQDLGPNEYVLLLGQGMLGVNLKPSYRKDSGVYVDFLVPDGSADRSGLVRAGDSLLQIGTLDVRDGSILTVPQQIAAAKRPIHLILSSGQTTADCLTYVDLCVTQLHQTIDKSVAELSSTSVSGGVPLMPTTPERVPTTGEAAENKTPTAGFPVEENRYTPLKSTAANNSARGAEDDDDDNSSVTADVGKEEDEEMERMKSTPTRKLPVVAVDPVTPPASTQIKQEGSTENDIPALDRTSSEILVRPPQPCWKLRHQHEVQAGQRGNEWQFQHPQNTSLWDHICIEDLPFQRALRYAFCLTVVDGRRLPFLVRFWGEQESALPVPPSPSSAVAVSPSAVSHKETAPNTLLMLYLELFQFMDMYDVMPIPKRLEMARKIAHKFFLPNIVNGALEPPMFDFHNLASDVSLRKLESLVSPIDGETEDVNDEEISGQAALELFVEFSHAVVERLTRDYLNFLLSDECARMRAYLRNTAPFCNLPLRDLVHVAARNPHHRAKNHILFMLTHLLSLSDPEEVGETNELFVRDRHEAPVRTRVEEAASTLCAALFIHSRILLPSENIVEETVHTLIASYESFWQIFLSPVVGSLDATSMCSETLAKVNHMRNMLPRISQQSDNTLPSKLVQLLSDPDLRKSWTDLAESLLYDYSLFFFSKFNVHKIHEWMCREAVNAIVAAPGCGSIAQTQDQKDGNHKRIPPLAKDCIKRLLRRVEFPKGVASHKPLLANTMKSRASTRRGTAECAIIFGTQVGLDFGSQTMLMNSHETIKRYICRSLVDECDINSLEEIPLSAEEIPPTLESYASPPSGVRPKPFGSYANPMWKSSDGWELFLMNFKIPQGSDDGSGLFGVSLVLRAPSALVDAEHPDDVSTFLEQSACPEDPPCRIVEEKDGGSVRQIRIPTDVDVFQERLVERSWRKRLAMEVQSDHSNTVIGLALLSRDNVIFSMRDALSMLLQDFAKTGSRLQCNGLVDFLGNFAYDDVEPDILRLVVASYIERAERPWIERPIGAQGEDFLRDSGEQLVRCLPPIALALLVVTVLLEQKVVLSCTRASTLFSVTSALTELLKPLTWCHLLVPRVPVSLAADLLQYPAPFILGLPADDRGMIELIRELPDDVTLVDLDVGRVILASSFAHNSELSRGTPKNDSTARALRSQVLSLAQSLGLVFGAAMDPPTWLSDTVSPSTAPSPVPRSTSQDQYEALKGACHDFVTELLAGTGSCCYWFEESVPETGEDDPMVRSAGDPTVVFDEDRFFHIKDQRSKKTFAPLFQKTPESTKLALAIEEFDLILEVFLRCQNMNAYIGSLSPEEMVFSL